MNRPTIPFLALLALAACTPEFDPASRVEKLRVLAVQADPPEIAPAPLSGTPAAPDRAALTSLVVRADFAAAPGREPRRRSHRPSTGCAPCTSRPAPGPPRPGR